MMILFYTLLCLAIGEISSRYYLGYKKGKKSKHTEQVIIEQPEPSEIKPFTGITSISVLTVRQFIQCVVHDNLTVLGEGTKEQLQDAFQEILSQYYEATGNEGAKHRIKILGQMKAIQMHAQLLNHLSDIFAERFTEAGAVLLRKLYPLYKFTPESIADDFVKVKQIEIKNSIKYENLEKEYNKLEVGKKATEKDLVMTLTSISKFQGAHYNLDTTVIEFATAQFMMMEHYRNEENNQA